MTAMGQGSGFRICRIINLEQLTEAFENGLIQLYQDIFAEPPYCEQFSDEEVRDLFTSYVTEGILFLAHFHNQVVGFGAAMPFAKSAIAHMEEEFGLDPDHTWYMAELGVRKDVRRRGLARQLVQVRLDAFPPGTYVIMRTSQSNIASQRLYRSFGFQLLSITQDVVQKRQNGTVQTDKRIFMIKRV